MVPIVKTEVSVQCSLLLQGKQNLLIFMNKNTHNTNALLKNLTAFLFKNLMFKCKTEDYEKEKHGPMQTHPFCILSFCFFYFFQAYTALFLFSGWSTSSFWALNSHKDNNSKLFKHQTHSDPGS